LKTNKSSKILYIFTIFLKEYNIYLPLTNVMYGGIN